jgi:hypothetical protein
VNVTECIDADPLRKTRFICRPSGFQKAQHNEGKVQFMVT